MPLSHRHTSAAGVAALMLFLLLPRIGLGQAVEAPPQTPVYRLTPGQQLRYRYDAEFNYDRGGTAGTQTAKGLWDFWVLSRNADQSWTVVFIQELQLFQKEGIEQYEGPKQVELMRFEIFPDGHLGKPGDGIGSLDPRMVFPALPLGAEPVWDDLQPSQTIRYRRVKPDAPSWSAESLYEGLIHDATLKSVVSVIQFSPENDRVEKVVSEVTSGYGTQGQGRSTVEFVSWTIHPPEATARRLSAASTYFAIVDEARLALRAGTYGIDGWQEKLEQAARNLARASEKVTEPPYAAKLKELRAQYDMQRPRVARNLEHRRGVIGTPGPAWIRKDFSGRKRTPEEFKGKTTVLAFWNRPNNWSIRMLPELKRLAATYADRPVTFLSLNNDRFRVDADFVLKRAELPFPTIEAAGLAEQYGLRAFPALVVLGSDGTIVNFHEGYTKQLIEDLRRDLDAQLTKIEDEKAKTPGG